MQISNEKYQQLLEYAKSMLYGRHYEFTEFDLVHDVIASQGNCTEKDIKDAFYFEIRALRNMRPSNDFYRRLEQVKVCIICQELLPVAAFYKNGAHLHSYCIECTIRINTAYYRKVKETDHYKEVRRKIYERSKNNKNFQDSEKIRKAAAYNKIKDDADFKKIRNAINKAYYEKNKNNLAFKALKKARHAAYYQQKKKDKAPT